MKINSLRLKIFFPLVVCIVIFVMLQSTFFFNKIKDSINDQVESKASDLAKTMAYLAESVQEKSELLRFVSAISAENDIQSIMVLEKSSNKIIVSNRYEYIGEKPSANIELFNQKNIQKAYDTKEIVMAYEDGSHQLLLVYMPVYLDFKEYQAKTIMPAIIIFSLDTGEINLFFDTIARLSAFATLIFGIAIYFLFYFLIDHFILKPHKKILSVVSKRASGQKGLYITNTSGDEIGRLSSEINKMLEIIMEQESSLIDATLKAEQSSLSKSVFLANMSHEFRTPLNGIIGFSEMVSETNLEQDQLEMVNTIRLCSDGLLSLINDVLDISKIEAQEITLENIPFNINKLLVEAFVLVQNKIVNKNIRLEIEQPLILCDVIGDPLRLKQVMINFLTNAAKFTEVGFIRLKLEILLDNVAEYKLKFSVQDTGIGMTGDQSEVIFDAFKQADQSTTRKYGGTGLGMSICKSLVALMGDEIALDTTIDKGSTFSFDTFMGKGPAIEINYRYQEQKECFLSEDVAQNTLNIVDNLHSLNVSAKIFNDLSSLLINKKDSAIPTVFIEYEEIKRMKFGKNDKLKELCHFIDKKRISLIVILPYLNEKILLELKKLKITYYIARPLWLDSLRSTLDRSWQLGKKESKKEALALGTSHKILVAEDNLVNQKLIMRVLKNLGHTVSLAKNGEEAVAKSLDEEFDLIFMDMQMPVMDGLEASRVIKKRDEKIPIVAMTANAFETDKEACFDAGMVDFLSKPVKKIEIVTTIEKHALNGTPGVLPSKRSIDKVPRVLVVEDEEKIRKIIVKSLHTVFKNVIVDEADNGYKACAKLGENVPDVVVTDLRMPQMDGSDFVEFIFKEENYKEVKIIVYSGLDKDHHILQKLRETHVEKIMFKTESALEVAKSVFEIVNNKTVLKES
ncbi:MAG: hypothetical protein COA79_12455 [Planctomycetota bacterium]|nr:MAG: hypothetical protein COA79_12455 [Planctomycetota bacterium]